METIKAKENNKVLKPEELISDIEKLSKNIASNIEDVSFAFEANNLKNLFKILSKISNSELEINTQNDFIVENENIILTIDSLTDINEDLFELIKKLNLVSKLTKTDFKSIISVLVEYSKEVNIVLLRYTNQESYQTSKNKMEFSVHYEEILNNDPELKALYEDLNTYFKSEVNKRKLHKISQTEPEIPPSGKKHYFHKKNTTDSEKSFHIIFQINKNCNFKCTYCYEGLDKVTEILSIDDVPNIVNGIKIFMEELKEKEGLSKVSFSILGGEPTLVPQKTTQLLTKLLNDELDLKYIALITNNYSAERTINFFHPEFPRDKIKIQVSYDGGVLQDKYRKDSKKNGTKELLTNEIHKLINSDENIKIALKATLPLESVSSVPEVIKDYITFEEKINAKNDNPGNFSYYPTFDTSSILMYNLRKDAISGNNHSKEKLFKEIDETFKFLLKFELDRVLDKKTAFSRWFVESSYVANSNTCSAGSNLFGIDQDGIGRFCHRTEFGETHTNIKYPYKKDQLNSLNYGKIENTKNFINNFFETKEKLEVVRNSDKKDYSYCNSCKTLTCVNCPMINVTPDRALDTSTTGDLYKDMYSHGLNLACEVNNYISKYLYIYDKIINNGEI